MTDTSIEIPDDTAPSRIRPRGGSRFDAPPSESTNPDDVATVDERIRAFRTDHPAGVHETTVERWFDTFGVPTYQVEARVWLTRDTFDGGRPDSTAHATRTLGVGDAIAAGSPLETAESVALGRALRYLGYGT